MTVANYLKRLHKEGKCHGAVKPENIFIDTDGVADILDPEIC